jgi:DNA-binding HxlR family transcriptional regulator
MQDFAIPEFFGKGQLFSDKCPSRNILRHVTSKWGVLVLIGLIPGTMRFSELRRKIHGVSERMLAQTLQDLEGDGIILRNALPVVPPHVEYSLTPLGTQLAHKVLALGDWIEENMRTLQLAQVELKKAG